MSSFLRALRSGRVLLMDGAMGTELQRAGMPDGACHELWNLTHPERVLAVHRAYAGAGADCLLTNTFQANPAALSRHGLADALPDILTAGVALAREAAGPGRFVLASVGPVERPHESVTAEMMRPLLAADGILVETCSDLDTFRAVIRHSGETPVLLSLTYLRDRKGRLRTFAGLKPEECAWEAEDEAAALGVNCGRDMTMADCARVLRRYRRACAQPLFARPNAGTPVRAGEEWVYPHTPAAMAAGLPSLLEAGARMVGGCCGTTPEHVRAFRSQVAAGEFP